MKDKILSLIRRSELTRIADDLTSLLRYAISMKTRSVDAETDLPLGTSKIGGLPDLPRDIDWPEWNEQRLPLIAQIRLADLAPYDHASELPHSGILYFFFNDEALETYPLPHDSWYVIYHNGDFSDLLRMQVSTEEQLVYPACAIEFSTRLTLPPYESLYIERLGLTDEAYHREAPIEQRREADAYEELEKQLDELYDSAPPNHQLLGHPYQIQGDLLLECQRDTHYKGDPTDWRLLLQVDSDDNTAMMWGDVGLLYFYIPQKALAARDFSQVHLIMQCS